METDIPADCEKTQAPPALSDLERHLRAQKRQAYEAMESAGCDRPTGMIGRLHTEAEILSLLFSYHPPTGETLPKFQAINQAAKNFAEIVLQNCPSSADRSDAIRKIREARMTANAAIALNGLSL
jgi:hypothetical protein